MIESILIPEFRAIPLVVLPTIFNHFTCILRLPSNSHLLHVQ